MIEAHPTMTRRDIVTPAEDAHHQAIERQAKIIEELRRQYSFGTVSAEQREDMDEFRRVFLEVAIKVVNSIPENRARSLALTKLQEAKMFAVQAIVDGESNYGHR